MTYILCPELAPIPVTSLLKDLQFDDTELHFFIEAITAGINVEDFGKSSLVPNASVCACEAIALLVHCRILDTNTRVAYLENERPQEDFEPEDYETWDGVLLAIQFASDELLARISSKIPIELIGASIAVIPPDHQKRARTVFYQ